MWNKKCAVILGISVGLMLTISKGMAEEGWYKATEVLESSASNIMLSRLSSVPEMHKLKAFERFGKSEYTLRVCRPEHRGQYCDLTSHCVQTEEKGKQGTEYKIWRHFYAQPSHRSIELSKFCKQYDVLHGTDTIRFDLRETAITISGGVKAYKRNWLASDQLGLMISEKLETTEAGEENCE